MLTWGRASVPTDHASTDAVVRLADVTASYGTAPVLHETSLTIERGEIVSLLGPSGCGKTSLLRVISGLSRIDSGTVYLSGELVSAPGVHVAPERRQVGMVFQDGALFPHLTVAENVRFGLRRRADAKARTADALELTDLAALADRLPGTLSGGQQQRVALARALAPQPSVLLLDEPFSALDAGLRVQLRREVKAILHEVGITSIVVTHDQDEAFSLADRVAVMRQGRVLQVGTPIDLYEQPVAPWVASFVGDGNEMVGPLHDGKVSTVVGDLEVLVGDAVDGDMMRVMVRPEQLELIAGGDQSIAAVEYYGHDARYDVTTAGGAVGVRSPSAAFGVGDAVELKFIGGVVPAWPAGEPVRD